MQGTLPTGPRITGPELTNGGRATLEPGASSLFSTLRINLHALGIGVGAPVIASRHPLRVNGTARLLAHTPVAPNSHYEWFQGETEDTSTPVGNDAAELTTPHLSNSTSYWYRITDETGTMDSPAVLVEVIQPEGVRVELTAPYASYTQFGSADETLSDPVNGFWSPGNQEAFLVWDFDDNRYLMGAGPYAALEFSIVFAPEYSLGSFRLQYLADPDHGWRPFQFGGGSSSDGATMFQQNQPYFSGSTIQITDPASLGRVDYRVNVHDGAVPGKIRQVRLYAIKGDPHLPSSGPGRGFNGVFEITEGAVVDMTGPPPSIPSPWHLTSDVIRNLPFRLSFNYLGGWSETLALEYRVEYEWYEGASGDLSHPLGTTTTDWIVLPGIDRDTPYWVRVTTVNGSSDSDTAVVSPGSVPATTILAGPVINPANGHLYYLLTPAPWPQSEEAAVSLGGHLVTINDAAENDWVYNTFKALLIGANGGNEVLLWLGLNDSKTQGVFAWSSGEPAQYRNWTVGEPNNHLGVEHYVDMDATTPPAAPPWALSQWEDAAADDFRGWRKHGVVEIDPNLSGREQWTIGVRDLRSSEFSQENNRADAAPGKVTRVPADPAYDSLDNPAPDDDYYFAGDYPAGFNSLSTPLHLPFDEPFTAWERALTSNDRINRFHFTLRDHQLTSSVKLRLALRFRAGTYRVAGVWHDGFSHDQVIVRIRNSAGVSTLLGPIEVTSPQDIQLEFSPLNAGAVSGPNTIELERLGPTLVGTFYAINMDYVQLSQINPQPNQPPRLAVPDREIGRYAWFEEQLAATDDGTPATQLSYWKIDGPAGLTVSPEGLVRWNPDASIPFGSYGVEVAFCDRGSPIQVSTARFNLRVSGIAVGPPVITSRHPIRVNGTVRLEAPTPAAPNAHYEWFQGERGDVSTPVGTDAPELTTPHLSNSTSYWYRVSDGTGATGHSPAAVVEVLQPEGVRVQLQVADASYTQFGAPENTLTPPDDVSIWSPGNQDAWIRYWFGGSYMAGLFGYAHLQAYLTFPPSASLGSFRLKGSLWNGMGEYLSVFQFGGATTSDGSSAFQQNQPYFAESTVQITNPATDARTSYSVYWYSYDLANPLSGVRLEAAKGDPHLPSSGPGRGENGYFAIDEVAIVDKTGPPPAIAGSWQYLPATVFSDVPFRVFIYNERPWWMYVDAGYHVEFEWFEGVSGDLSHPISRTTNSWLDLPGLHQDTPYWVRITTVNGSSDTETAIISPRNVPLVLSQAADCSKGEIEVQLRVQGLDRLSGFQGSIQWDPAEVEYVGIESSLLTNLTSEVSVADSARGALQLMWNAELSSLNSPRFVLLGEDSEVLRLRFKLIGARNSKSIIRLSDDPLPWRLIRFPIYGDGDQVVPILSSIEVENLCPNFVSGVVGYYNGSTPVRGLTIRSRDSGSGQEVGTTQTAGDGVYRLDLSEGPLNFIISGLGDPERSGSDAPYQGISMLDSLRIRQHLLGLNPISSDLEKLAADVDRNHEINIGDSIRVQRLVAWGDAMADHPWVLPTGRWIVVTADGSPTNPSLPWTWPSFLSIYPEDLQQVEIPGRNFIGIKLGDADGSWGAATIPAAAAPALARSAEVPDPIELKVGSALGEAGGSVRVGVQSSSVGQLTTAQFSLHWDPRVLEYIGVGQFTLRGLGAENFGTLGVTNGVLTLAWDDPLVTGVPVKEGQTWFTVEFKATGGPGMGGAVGISSHPTRGELSRHGIAVPFTASEGFAGIRRSDGGALGTFRHETGSPGLWFEVPEKGRWTLESSEDLLNWIPVSGATEAAQGGLTHLAPHDSDRLRQFYRVKFLP